MRIVSPLRSVFLSLKKPPVNKSGWEKRMLIVNLEALGDLIVFTSVLKLYKKSFPDKKIFLLVKSGIGLEKFFAGNFVDEVITVNYRKFAVNPFYGSQFIRELRGIGFETVINHDFSAAEILGKTLSTELGAKNIIGYEGLGIEWREPFDFQQSKNLTIVKEKIFPKFTKLIPSIDKNIIPTDRLKSAVRHYAAIYEGVTGMAAADYSTFLPRPPKPEESEILKKFGLSEESYVALGVGASVPYKRWPVFNFGKVVELLTERGLKTVLVGARGDSPTASELKNIYFPAAIDLTGRTSLGELIAILGNSKFIFTNDTSLVHFAVALRKPSICVTGGGHFGMFANYGYPGKNRWLYKKADCFFDSWRCGKGLADGEPSPCLAAVAITMALDEVRMLLENLDTQGGFPGFQVEFQQELPKKSSMRKIKIVYSDIQSENYDPRRRFSFGYNNFYMTLKSMAEVEVIEYPFDLILKIGKEKFNSNLLHLVKREKPDLFFAFVFSDELDKKTLDEIKNTTKSVAWFADDQWRIFNYSRFYAQHFTSAVTTWSLAPRIYSYYGIDNIIRSQWACNPKVWKPLPGEKKIDVSFVGQRTAARARIIDKLRDAGIKTHVRGWGWPEGRATPEEMIKIFSSSKISLNLNDPPNIFLPKTLGRLVLRRSINKLVPSFNLISNFKSWKNMRVPQIKARAFELAGCRAFVISGMADDINRYYEENKEMVFYRDIGDLIQKIKYYLNHEKEREQIAEAAYKRTLAEHTYGKRFGDIFTNVGL